jgi:hypothetical protein
MSPSAMFWLKYSWSVTCDNLFYTCLVSILSGFPVNQLYLLGGGLFFQVFPRILLRNSCGSLLRVCLFQSPFVVQFCYWISQVSDTSFSILSTLVLATLEIQCCNFSSICFEFAPLVEIILLVESHITLIIKLNIARVVIDEDTVKLACTLSKQWK